MVDYRVDSPGCCWLERDHAHMHTHRADRGRDTRQAIQTGETTHTPGRRQGCHDEIMTIRAFKRALIVNLQQVHVSQRLPCG